MDLLPDPTVRLYLTEEPEQELNEEETEYMEKKNKAVKCKVIALHRFNLHPIKTNIKYLKSSIKSKLVILIETLFDEYNENNDIEFNNIISDLFFDFEEDYTTYPIYQSIVKL